MGKAIIIKDVDFSLVGLGKVTSIEVTPLISLTINGDDVIEKYGNYSVSYFPYTTNERHVEWSIVSGNEYATINNGKVSVKLNVDNQPVTIRVTSKIRPEIYAEKTIYVTGANKLLDVDQVFTGTLVQPYNSGTNKMRVVLIDSEFQDVSDIINEYNN